MLRGLLGFLHEAIEQYDNISVVQNEGYPIGISAVLHPKLKDTVPQLFYKLLVPAFGLLHISQHIYDLFLRSFFKATEEVLEMVFEIFNLPYHVAKIAKVSLYDNFRT